MKSMYAPGAIQGRAGNGAGLLVHPNPADPMSTGNRGVLRGRILTRNRGERIMKRQSRPTDRMWVVLTLLLVLASWCCIAQAQVPHKVAYQGFLTS